ncbi:MAG: dephospho-CoA kinase, partial [Pseudomonadota bacterium]|nr:dephospho-CoA kinase [Pseudomonadota bacterium]
ADQIWVTVVKPAVAIERACARDNLSEDAVRTRLDAQLSNDERGSYADHVIDNSSDEAHLLAQVASLWAQVSST